MEIPRIKTCLILTATLFASLLSAASPDSLLALLQREIDLKNKPEELRLTLQVANAWLAERDFEQALASFKTAQSLANQQDNRDKFEQALLGTSKTHQASGNFFQAIKTCHELVAVIQEKGEGNLAQAYSQLAEACQSLGNNELAFDYQLQALHLHNEAGDTSAIARSLYNIGTIFFYQDNYELALDYYRQALSWCEAMRSKRHIFSALSAIGSAYNRLGQLQESLDYNQRALKLAEELDYKTGLSYAMLNVGADHLKLGNYDRALTYFFQSLKLKKDLSDKWGEAGNQRLIGEAFLNKGNFAASLKHFNASLQLSEQMKSKPRLVEIYRALADFHDQTGDFEQSNHFLWRYAMLKDTLASEAALQNMGEIKSRYEILEKEEALRKKGQQMKQLILYALIGGVALLAFSLWMLFSRYREHVKNNRLLEAKNQQIQAQNEELAQAFRRQREAIQKIQEQYQLLEQSNADLQRFAYIASHDLKEPLRTIGSYANLLQRRYGQQLDRDADEFLNYITSGAKRLYKLLTDILVYSKLGADGEQYWANLPSILETVRQNLQNQIEEKNARLHVGRLPILKANPAHLLQLFQNLVQNGLKYCDKAQPEIWLDCRQKGEFY
ncbi:MAG: tetratricopeptide repeat protein, partial [Bacteroidota bacterium]